MERTTDSKVPAALILAGLALFVALSGRSAFSPFGGAQSQSIAVRVDPANLDAQPAPLVDPNGSGDPSSSLPQGESLPIKPMPPVPNLQKVPMPAFVPADPAQGKLQYAVGADRNPLDDIGNYIQGLVAYLSPLFQLGALVLLIWLAFRYLNQRSRPGPGYIAAPPPPQAPPPAASHGDIVQPESRSQD